MIYINLNIILFSYLLNNYINLNILLFSYLLNNYIKTKLKSQLTITNTNVAPDGVTRHTESMTQGHALRADLSAGLIADGHQPRISINNVGQLSQGSYEGEAPSRDHLHLPRVQIGHGFGRTDDAGA